MSRLTSFFKDTGTDTGVFYPKHYLVAVFSNLADANGAKLDLGHSGRLNEDAIAASGEEVIQYAESHVLEDGLWGVLMTELSRTIGTEAAYADRDLAAAKAGAAFLAVRCPNEAVKTQAWKTLEPWRPLTARYYSLGGIEHLTGEL